MILNIQTPPNRGDANETNCFSHPVVDDCSSPIPARRSSATTVPPEASSPVFDMEYTHTPQFSPINLNVQNKPVKNSFHPSNSDDEADAENNANLSNSFHAMPSPIFIHRDEQELVEESRNDHEEYDREDLEQEQEESEEQRRLREEAESEALARQLMAEEAISSYHQSANYLQENASEYNEEDLATIRNLMAEENPVLMANEDQDAAAVGMDSDEMSYEALLNLGDRIGDVKSDRWALVAEKEILKLQTLTFSKKIAEGKDENDTCVKCLVCQFPYEEDETVRVLPCRHYFHDECVSPWLMSKDFCPYCRQCIVIEKDNGEN